MNGIANRLPGWRGQRGMAVIGALLVVVVASVSASRLIERQGLLTQSLIAENDRLQAIWLLRGGLDWARVVLDWDARRNPTTRGDAEWARPIDALSLPLPDEGRSATFTGRIEDAQARLNLNNLAREGRVLPEQQRILERLLALLQLPPALATDIAARIAQGQPAPGRPAPLVALRDIGDLASLPGMTPEGLDLLRPYLTVLPEPTPVNPNTARPEVLSALYEGLSLADARLQADRRDKGQWFNDPADFLNRTRQEQNPRAARDTLATRSAWFRVLGQVSLGQAAVGLEALLHRDPQGTSRILWIRELR